MSDPVLLLLTVDVVALLLLGTFAAAVPKGGAGFMATGLCGLGILLCLPPLLLAHRNLTTFRLPLGPPGLSLHFALDPLAACFLLIAFIAGTAIAAVQAIMMPATPLASVRVTAFCVGGTALSVLAADGVTLAIGLTIACESIRLPRDDGQRTLLIPLLLLAAVCLLTPSGFAPRFDTIRAAPVDPDHATAASVMIIAGTIFLIWFRPLRHCWTRDALFAGVVVPVASYLLLRLVGDLFGSGVQAPWGYALLLSGGTTAVIHGWRSAAHPDIDIATVCLSQRQGGMAMIGIGLALVARTADLPGAASLALGATLLSAIGGGLAGTLTSLAAHCLGESTGSYRLSQMGGLIYRQPGTSAAFAAGLIGQSGMLPGFGFACLWLLLQSILSAPRGSGLPWQLVLALTAAAIALSAALATAATVRLIGIALLGHPRTQDDTVARDGRALVPLLVLAGLSLLAGLLPATTIWVLAGRAIHALTTTPPGGRTGAAFLSFAISAPGYLALPVLALVALAAGAAMLTRRGSRKDAKEAGFWADGMVSPGGLPVAEPAARSTGAGFLPALPLLRLSALPRLIAPAALRRPSAVAGLWLLLAASAFLLLILSVTG